MIHTRNNTIDLLRIITCPFILLIHCPLPGELGQTIIRFGRFGVPFFLLLSGWFSYKKSPEQMIHHAKKKLIDTVKLLGTFAVAYFIFHSLSSIMSGEMAFEWITDYLNLYTFVNLILFNRALFFGSTGYYPFMLIYVYLFFIFFIKTNLLKTAFVFIPVLLTVNSALGAFTNLPWFCYGNFLFTGLPFFLLGHLLHKNDSKLTNQKTVWVCAFLLGVVLTFVQALINPDLYCYVGSILMAVSLLIVAVNCEYIAPNQTHLNTLKRYSVYIFVIHCGIRDVLRELLNRHQIAYSEYVFVGAIILLSLLICAIWDRFAVHRKA